jgi:curved DNA-binding protein CbpA
VSDPYETLGVDRDADDDAIKDAYRKKAHRAHPDKPGGEGATFHAIVKAYESIKDKEARDRHERGETKQDPRHEAFAKLAGLMMQALQNCDVDHDDLVAKMKSAINSSDRAVDAEIAKIRVSIRTMQRALKRLKGKSKDDEDPLRQIILGHIRTAESALRQGAKEKESNALMISLLDGYAYESEPRPSAQTISGTFVIGGTPWDTER